MTVHAFACRPVHANGFHAVFYVCVLTTFLLFLMDRPGTILCNDV